MVISKDESMEQLKAFGVETILRMGEEAMSYYGRGRSQVKFDEGLVTEAELHLKDVFHDRLYATFPDHQVFMSNHEHQGYTHESKRYLWIYDLVDGVANFQAGIPIWGISLALLDNFWPLFGLYYMPTTGDFFHALAGQKAFRGEEEIHVSRQKAMSDESLLLTYSRFHQRYVSTFPGKIRDLGCTGYHICYAAMGRAEAVLLANEAYKDLAAAAVIVEAAGGKIVKMDGKDFFLSDYLDGRRIDEHLLVVAPDTYQEIRGYLHEKR